MSKTQVLCEADAETNGCREFNVNSMACLAQGARSGIDEPSVLHHTTACSHTRCDRLTEGSHCYCERKVKKTTKHNLILLYYIV